jgi:hypothetical protein
MIVKPPRYSLPSAKGPSVIRTSLPLARTTVAVPGSCSPPAKTHAPAARSSWLTTSRSRMIGSSFSGGSEPPVGWYIASRYWVMGDYLLGGVAGVRPASHPLHERTRAKSTSRREPEDELHGLDGGVELWAMSDALELDPIGVREPVVPEARGRRRPWQQPVGRAPDDPHRADDALGVERPACAVRAVDEGISA